MSASVPDLFDRDKSFAPAAQTLRSRKRETYCQEVSGECWGNNTEAYCRAFGVTDRAAASASAARLMRDPSIRARIGYLRDESIERMGVDRAWILEKRKHIVEHARNAADRLRALEDLEKSLGGRAAETGDQPEHEREPVRHGRCRQDRERGGVRADHGGGAGGRRTRAGEDGGCRN